MSPASVAVMALLIAMGSVQSGAAFAKQLFPVLGAAGTASLRALLAAIMLWCVWRPWRRPVQPKVLALIAAYGVSLGLMNLLFYCALARIPLGVAVALEFTGPLAVALVGSKHRIHYLWVALASLGVVFIMPLGITEPTLDPWGIILALTAGAAWAAYIVLGSKVGKLIETGQAAALGMTFAAIVVLPFGIKTAGKTLWTPALLPWATLVAFMSSALPYTLEMFALRRLPARSFGILMSLEPACGAIAGAVILQQSLSPVQILAIICVTLASLGTTLTGTSKPAITT